MSRHLVRLTHVWTLHDRYATLKLYTLYTYIYFYSNSCRRSYNTCYIDPRHDTRGVCYIIQAVYMARCYFKVTVLVSRV